MTTGTIDTGEANWAGRIALSPKLAPLVDRLERAAAADIGRFRLRVLTAGLLGYSAIATPLLAVLSILLLAIAAVWQATWWIEVPVFLGIAAAFLFGVFRVPDPLLLGLEVKRNEVPALFALIDRVGAATGGPTVHSLRLLDTLSAAITQRSGGWAPGHRNLLYLGLPMLYAMQCGEIEAVLAHEFGHFTGRHAQWYTAANRLSRRWAQLGERVPTGVVAALWRRFFAWYGPWYAVHSLVLSRRHEFEADRVAAGIVGSRMAAQALMRVMLKADRFDRVWAEAERIPVTPERGGTRWTALLAQLAKPDLYETVADSGFLQQQVTIADTHPTVASRLRAMGEVPRQPPPLGLPAAANLLGPMAQPIIAELDAAYARSGVA